MSGSQQRPQGRDLSSIDCALLIATFHPKMKIERPAQARTLPKAPTGIDGLDEITGGGLPRGRPTLVCGGAGCGKTLLGDGVPGARRDAVRRARRVHHLRGDRRGAGAERALARLRPRRAGRDRRRSRSTTSASSAREIEETGEYDLEGLFLRLGLAIDSVGAKRVVLDTIEIAVRRLRRTRRCCAPSCGACSAGSRTRASPRSSPASAATARSRARGSRSTSPTA